MRNTVENGWEKMSVAGPRGYFLFTCSVFGHHSIFNQPATSPPSSRCSTASLAISPTSQSGRRPTSTQVGPLSERDCSMWDVIKEFLCNRPLCDLGLEMWPLTAQWRWPTGCSSCFDTFIWNNCELKRMPLLCLSN